jgi:WD40 repeat protein
MMIAKIARRAAGLFSLLFVALFAFTAADAQNTQTPEVVSDVGHAQNEVAAVFSPDGRLVVSGGHLSLKVWDVKTGKLLRTITTDGVMYGLAFDDNRIIAGGFNRRGKFYTLDPISGKTLRTFTGGPGRASRAYLSPDKRKIAFVGGNTLTIWDLDKGEQLFSANEDVTSAAFTKDGSRLIAAGRRSIKIWDASNGKPIREVIGEQRRRTLGNVQIALSPDETYLVASAIGDATRGNKPSDSDVGGQFTLSLIDVESGKVRQTFGAHAKAITQTLITANGSRILSASRDGTIKLWDTSSGQMIYSIDAHRDIVYSIDLSRDGKFILSTGGDSRLRLWDSATGKLVREFGAENQSIDQIATLPNNPRTVLAAVGRALYAWDIGTGRPTPLLDTGHASPISSIRVSPDGNQVATISSHETRVWNLASAKLEREFKAQPNSEWGIVAYLPGKSFILSEISGNLVRLWNPFSEQAPLELRHPAGDSSVTIKGMAFSPDGRLIAVGYERLDNKNGIALWDRTSGKPLGVLDLGDMSRFPDRLAFTPNGERLVSAGSGGSGTFLFWDGKNQSAVRSHDELVHLGSVEDLRITADSKRALTASNDGTIKISDLGTGQQLNSFVGHAGGIKSVVFSADEKLIYSAGADGTIRAWNAGTGRMLTTFMVDQRDGEWVAITEEGFFAASPKGGRNLNLVRGLESVSIGQVYQSLFNPDLVREKLNGDPNGEVRDAAKLLNLGKVMDSGPAPDVTILTRFDNNQATGDLVTVEARIRDTGKGIGRIEWRVNGITSAVSQVPRGKNAEITLKQALALDAGDNNIELIAYTADNVLASVPAQIAIKYSAPANQPKPKLFVLAVGINQYVDKGYTPPGTTDVLKFSPLSLAVGDAKSIAEDLKRAGGGQYEDVVVTLALDTDATQAGIDKAIDAIASRIHPRDTFVLFAASHGFSHDGRFYLIPQDYDGGSNPEALNKNAIGQDRIQDWIGNRIKAKKAIVLLDTCESGALVSGRSRTVTDAAANEAAIGRLHEATGRPILTAAASGKPAFEGYKGHGVFTWALLDALQNADRNKNGMIELSELVTHVQDNVPKASAELNGRGLTKFVTRGSTGDSQSARFGSRGEDFGLVRRIRN